jgi:hypothetical protein
MFSDVGPNVRNRPGGGKAVDRFEIPKMLVEGGAEKRPIKHEKRPINLIRLIFCDSVLR